MRTAIAIVILIASLAAAQAFGMGKMGFNFGREGAIGKRGVAVIQPTGDILLADGTSLILQTDGASFICRAGGC